MKNAAIRNDPVELRPNAVTSEQVDAARREFRKSTLNNKAAAQNAAILALIFAYQHRTASKLRKLLEMFEADGTAKDFLRRAPFTMWLVAFAPVKMVSKEIDGKKVKVLEFNTESKLLEVEEETIAKATAKLWWTMSKDKEVGAFDVADFDRRIIGIAKAALKKFEDQPAGVVDQQVKERFAKLVGDFTTHEIRDRAISEERKRAAAEPAAA